MLGYSFKKKKNCLGNRFQFSSITYTFWSCTHSLSFQSNLKEEKNQNQPRNSYILNTCFVPLSKCHLQLRYMRKIPQKISILLFNVRSILSIKEIITIHWRFLFKHTKNSKKAMQCMKRSQIAIQATILLTSKRKERNSLIWLLVCKCSFEEQIIELENASGRTMRELSIWVLYNKHIRKKGKIFLKNWTQGTIIFLTDLLSKAYWQSDIRAQSHIN